jgi:hypothetical protein
MKKYILLLFLGITFTLNAQDIMIDVPVSIQEQSKWCAVASSQCVLRYFGPFVHQCTIMEYVRQVTLSYGIYDCCDDATKGCNGGISLYGGKGSVQAILSHFGEINSVAPPMWLWPDEIGAYLRNDRPLIIGVEVTNQNAGHAVVIYGKDVGIGKDLIYYMDPRNDTIYGIFQGGKQKIPYNQLISGFNFQYTWLTTLVIGDALYPAHCFNGKCDVDSLETDVDCGGRCQPCKAPPTTNCSNCKKDDGEVEIDCGGPNCPPCADLPEEIIIDNKVYNKSCEVMAFKKITAGKYMVWVNAGVEVTYITSDTGLIVLRPGFTAEKGSNFRAYRKDLTEYSRICPEKLCSTASIPAVTYRKYFPQLRIYNLLYAVKITYVIADMKGNTVYNNAIDIARNGTFDLWNCVTGATITQGKVTYQMVIIIQYCNGDVIPYYYRFVVMDYPDKSSTEEAEEAEDLDTSQSSSSDNLKIQNKISPPSLSIIPNPNPGAFQLETNFPLSEIASLKVTNFLGASVYKTQNITEHTLQLQNAASGIYFVVIVLKDGSVLTQKMVVQR